MKNTFKTLAALLIIGMSFTACTKEEAAPAERTLLEDFNGAYRYVKGASREFQVEVRTREILMVSHEYPIRMPERIYDIQRVDENSFNGKYTIGYNNISQIFGEALIFIDPSGVRTISIRHINGIFYEAQEVQ